MLDVDVLEIKDLGELIFLDYLMINLNDFLLIAGC